MCRTLAQMFLLWMLTFMASCSATDDATHERTTRYAEDFRAEASCGGFLLGEKRGDQWFFFSMSPPIPDGEKSRRFVTFAGYSPQFSIYKACETVWVDCDNSSPLGAGAAGACVSLRPAEGLTWGEVMNASQVIVERFPG